MSERKVGGRSATGCCRPLEVGLVLVEVERDTTSLPGDEGEHGRRDRRWSAVTRIRCPGRLWRKNRWSWTAMAELGMLVWVVDEEMRRV